MTPPPQIALSMILALLTINLNPGGSHIGFRQYGDRNLGHPKWRPSKIEKVLFGQHIDLCQILCLWKNLNQTLYFIR